MEWPGCGHTTPKCLLTRPADIKNEKFGLLDKPTEGFKGESNVREHLKNQVLAC